MFPDGPRFRLTPAEGAEVTGGKSDIEVSQRIGNIPRRLTLPDGSLFETTDNDAVDQWLGQDSELAGSGLMHQMESRWSWIAISLVAVVAMVYLGGRYGLPWASERIAYWLPDRVVEYVSSGSMDLLDQVFLDPSELSEPRKEAARTRFAAIAGESYRLHFRKLGAPNALALPAGDIVVTDAFVRLANGPEFDAVILHEIGHVELRHGMQQLVQSSIVTFIVAMIVGDPSGLEEVIVGLPIFLMQSHYSRKHEASADEYAFAEMMERGIDPIHFARIMEKMTAATDLRRDTQSDNESTEDRERSLNYLSSHPATGDRIRRAEELSRQFQRSR